MSSTRPNRALVYALYANAAVLLTILLVLLLRDSTPAAALAQLQPAIAGGAGVYVVPAQFSRDVFGCYLMDVDAQTLCVYRFDPTEKVLRLAAARSFRYDRKLGNFNTGLPSPAEVRDLLEKESRPLHTAEPAPAPPGQRILEQPATRE